MSFDRCYGFAVRNRRKGNGVEEEMSMRDVAMVYALLIARNSGFLNGRGCMMEKEWRYWDGGNGERGRIYSRVGMGWRRVKSAA